MKCTYCGSDIEAGAKFCTNCGKENVSEPPVNQQPLNSTTNEAMPVITPQTAQQPVPVQPKQKKNNTVLIVVGIIVGILVILGIVAVLVVRLIFTNVVEKLQKFELEIPEINNFDYDNLEDGKVVLKVKDPIGHEITIVEDNIYLIKTEVSYLYDQARELRENAKIATKEEIDKLDATDIQKLATKKAVDILSNYTYSKKELQEQLEKENYDADTIEFAIENCGVDWEEQTKIAAVNIMAAGGFSKKELISLLVYEGYEEEYAKKAAEIEDFDFYEQAVYDACFYKFSDKKYSGSKSREEAESQLRYSEYSESEISFALKTVYDEMGD